MLRVFCRLRKACGKGYIRVLMMGLQTLLPTRTSMYVFQCTTRVFSPRNSLPDSRWYPHDRAVSENFTSRSAANEYYTRFLFDFPREKKIENARKWRLLDVKKLREGSLWIRIISEHACACPVRSASKQGNNKIESYFSRRPTIGLSHSKRRLRHCRRHGRAMHRHFYSSYFSYFPRVSRPRDSRHTR